MKPIRIPLTAGPHESAARASALPAAHGIFEHRAASRAIDDVTCFQRDDPLIFCRLMRPPQEQP